MAERWYYLAQWDEPPNALTDYAPPQGVVGLFDARAATGTRYGFFAAERKLSAQDWTGIDAPDMHVFGDGTDLRDYHTSQAERDEWRSLLNLTADLLPDGDVDTLYDALILTFERAGDPDWAERFKPPTATHAGHIEFHLGGHSLINRRPFTGLPQAARDRILARVQKDMGDIVQHGQSGIIPRGKYRQVASFWARKYGLDTERRGGPDGWGRLFAPDIRQNVEPPKKPQTTATDDFTGTNGTLLQNHTSSEGWGWTKVDDGDDLEIQSNELEYAGTSPMRYRAETDMSSDDHTSQIDFVAVASGANGIISQAVRMDPADDTLPDHYDCQYSGADDASTLRKIVSGSATTLDTSATSFGAGDTLLTGADGSSIFAEKNSSQVLSATDTAIAGHLRGGVYRNNSSGTNDNRTDNFQIADIASGGTTFQPSWARGANTVIG